MPSESVCDGEKILQHEEDRWKWKASFEFQEKNPTSSPFYYYMIVDRVFEF